MEKKQQAPTTQEANVGAKFTVRYKGSIFSLSSLQFKMFQVLSNGKKHSSFRLMQQLRTSDPRKEIQYLRDKGINVQDVWVERQEIDGIIYPRHKEYYINDNSNDV